MKTLLLFSIIALFFLGACTETVYEEVIKYVDRPVPQFVEVSRTEECVSTDTAKVEIVLKDAVENGLATKDTVLAVTKACHIKVTIRGKVAVPHKTIEIHDSIPYAVHDSIPYAVHDSIPYPVYVDRPGPTVYKDTTIYETKIEYLATEYVYIFPGQSVTYIPTPFEPHFQSFRDEAAARNKLLPGGDIVLSQVDPSDLAGENWTSDSFEVAGFQWVIRISNELTIEQSKAAIYREMGRMQLKKKYSNNVSHIMSPIFRTSPDPTVQEINTLFQ